MEVMNFITEIKYPAVLGKTTQGFEGQVTSGVTGPGGVLHRLGIGFYLVYQPTNQPTSSPGICCQANCIQKMHRPQGIIALRPL